MPLPHGSASISAPDHIGVIRSAGEYRLIALRPIAAGERVLRIDGDVMHRPTRYSVQVGENQHVDIAGSRSIEETFDRYPWRFMNHSCQPSTWVRGRDVLALRSLQPWEDVTIDYNATEFDLAEPFVCRCRSARCHGVIRGFRHLSRDEQERLRPLLAPYLAERLETLPPGDALPVPA